MHFYTRADLLLFRDVASSATRSIALIVGTGFIFIIIIIIEQDLHIRNLSIVFQIIKFLVAICRKLDDLFN